MESETDISSNCGNELKPESEFICSSDECDDEDYDSDSATSEELLTETGPASPPVSE